MNTNRVQVVIDPDEKARLVARCNQLGVSISDAARRGIDLYCRSLELHEAPSPKRGRPPKEAKRAA